MARFRGAIKGRRRVASRLGDEASGITVRANGWDVGVKIRGDYFTHNSKKGKTELDSFAIYVTGGSNAKWKEVYIGEVLLDKSGKPVFRKAAAWHKRIGTEINALGGDRI